MYLAIDGGDRAAHLLLCVEELEEQLGEEEPLVV